MVEPLRARVYSLSPASQLNATCDMRTGFGITPAIRRTRHPPPIARYHSERSLPAPTAGRMSSCFLFHSTFLYVWYHARDLVATGGCGYDDPNCTKTVYRHRLRAHAGDRYSERRRSGRTD